jgi:hypothetical protein
VIVERCLACDASTDTDPSLYLPRPGAPGIECTLCVVCQGRIRCGDRALIEVIEFKLLMADA